MAVLTITVITRIAHILTRLPFGVVNGLHDFCLTSEPFIDLTNDIIRDETYDPTVTYSQIQNKLHPPNKRYEDITLFGIARKLFVPVPFHYVATDGYIDDLITVMLDMNGWVQKGTNAFPLAVHTLFRPVDPSDPLLGATLRASANLMGKGNSTRGR